MKHKFGKSISAKLNIWYTMLMFVLSVGLIFSVVTAARMAQNSQVQQELVRSVERNIDEIEVENGLLDIESDFAYTNGNTYAVVFSEDGKILGGEYPESFTAEIPLSEKQFENMTDFMFMTPRFSSPSTITKLTVKTVKLSAVRLRVPTTILPLRELLIFTVTIAKSPAERRLQSQ